MYFDKKTIEIFNEKTKIKKPKFNDINLNKKYLTYLTEICIIQSI